MDAILKTIDTIVFESLAQGNPIYIETLGTLAPKSTITTENGEEKLQKIVTLSKDKYGKSLTSVIRKRFAKEKNVNQILVDWFKRSLTENSESRIVFDIQNVVYIVINKDDNLAQITPSKDLQMLINPAIDPSESNLSDNTQPDNIQPELTPEATIDTKEKATQPKNTEVDNTKSEPMRKAVSPIAKSNKPLNIAIGIGLAIIVFLLVFIFIINKPTRQRTTIEPEATQTVIEPQSEKRVTEQPEAQKKIVAFKLTKAQKITEVQKTQKQEVVAKQVPSKTQTYNKTNPPRNENYMVIGVFKSKKNADRLMDKKIVQERNPYITFRNSLHYVLLPVDKSISLQANVIEIKKHFKDSWLLLLK